MAGSGAAQIAEIEYLFPSAGGQPSYAFALFAWHPRTNTCICYKRVCLLVIFLSRRKRTGWAQSRKTCFKWFKSCSVLNYMYLLPWFFVSTNNPENKSHTAVSGNVLAQCYEFIDMKHVYKIYNLNVFSLWKDRYSSFHLTQVEMLLCSKEENNCGYRLCWKKRELFLKTFKQASRKNFF